MGFADRLKNAAQKTRENADTNRVTSSRGYSSTPMQEQKSFGNTNKKAKALNQIMGYENQIAVIEKEISGIHTMLGKAYELGDKAKCDEIMGHITAKREKIKDLKVLIDEAEQSYRCPQCGNEYPDGAKFCPSCGYHFEDETKTNSNEIICKQCGNVLPANARFCNKCGTKVATDTIQNIVDNYDTPVSLEPVPILHANAEGKIEMVGGNSSVEKEKPTESINLVMPEEVKPDEVEINLTSPSEEKSGDQ